MSHHGFHDGVGHGVVNGLGVICSLTGDGLVRTSVYPVISFSLSRSAISLSHVRSWITVPSISIVNVIFILDLDRPHPTTVKRWDGCGLLVDQLIKMFRTKVLKAFRTNRCCFGFGKSRFCGCGTIASLCWGLTLNAWFLGWFNKRTLLVGGVDHKIKTDSHHPWPRR